MTIINDNNNDNNPKSINDNNTNKNLIILNNNNTMGYREPEYDQDFAYNKLETPRSLVL